METNLKLTKAKARVLIKASAGFVMISGGFSGVEDGDCIHSKNFDRRSHIEWLIRYGFLQGGDHANQFCLTLAGLEALDSLPRRHQWLYDEERAAQLQEEKNLKRMYPSC